MPFEAIVEAIPQFDSHKGLVVATIRVPVKDRNISLSVLQICGSIQSKFGGTRPLQNFLILHLSLRMTLLTGIS